MKNVAIFASGNGTNAENVIRELADGSSAEVVLVLTNNPAAGVIERAKKLNVKTEVIHETWNDADAILSILHEHGIDIVLLLGYLKLLPALVVQKYEGHILNLHPALLPHYGGKGMYGHFVHEAVARNHDNESGFTLHRVTPAFDEGEILHQQTVDLPDYATPQDVESLVRDLEQEHVASAVHALIESEKI